MSSKFSTANRSAQHFFPFAPALWTRAAPAKVSADHKRSIPIQEQQRGLVSSSRSFLLSGSTEVTDILMQFLSAAAASSFEQQEFLLSCATAAKP
jgi:hypothetical protein